MGVMRNKIACNAAVLQIKPRARLPRRQARRLPPEDIADGRNEKQNRVCRGSGFN